MSSMSTISAMGVAAGVGLVAFFSGTGVEKTLSPDPIPAMVQREIAARTADRFTALDARQMESRLLLRIGELEAEVERLKQDQGR